MQRHQHLELTFVMFVWEKMRITAIGQGGVIRLTALDRPAQVVHERFTHQVFREVTPGLRTVAGADPRQNTQPRLFTFRL